MLNNNTHIGIVGAGNIGSSIYQLIVSAGFDYKLSIADITDDAPGTGETIIFFL